MPVWRRDRPLLSGAVHEIEHDLEKAAAPIPLSGFSSVLPIRDGRLEVPGWRGLPHSFWRLGVPCPDQGPSAPFEL